MKPEFLIDNPESTRHMARKVWFREEKQQIQNCQAYQIDLIWLTWHIKPP